MVDYQNTEESEIWRWESEGGCTGVEIRNVVRIKRPRPAVTTYKAIDRDVATMRHCQWSSSNVANSSLASASEAPAANMSRLASNFREVIMPRIVTGPTAAGNSAYTWLSFAH